MKLKLSSSLDTSVISNPLPVPEVSMPTEVKRNWRVSSIVILGVTGGSLVPIWVQVLVSSHDILTGWAGILSFYFLVVFNTVGLPNQHWMKTAHLLTNRHFLLQQKGRKLKDKIILTGLNIPVNKLKTNK